MKTPAAQSVDINVVGSSIFGRYPKISSERTYNMFISDNWLVNYAGYKSVSIMDEGAHGRGLFHSVRGNFMLAVVGQAVYKLTDSLVPQFVGSIDSGVGDVYMDENLSGQICLVDGNAAYIYNDSILTLTKQSLGISGLIPNYVSYHNTFFLIGNGDSSANGAKWYVFEYSTDTTIAQVSVGGEQALENKPDTALAVVRVPGKGNHVMVFGKTVGASFSQVGGLLNYQRSASFNLDYGVVSVATIATSDELICWLSQNENNAPVIMVSSGDAPQRISTDGIDFLLGGIKYPEQSIGFFYRQDGHLFYQLTFYNEEDNRSLTYDFNTKSFFILSDEDNNFYPIRRIVYFNNKVYGISINDGHLYQIGSEFTDYDYGDGNVKTIPRIRICKSIRKKDAERFRANVFNLWIEQGTDPDHTGITPSGCAELLVTEDVGDTIITEDDLPIIDELGYCDIYEPRVDVSFSKNGGQSFSSYVSKDLNTEGHYRNQFTMNRLGAANELIIQLRFWTRSRTVVGQGSVEVY